MKRHETFALALTLVLVLLSALPGRIADGMPAADVRLVFVGEPEVLGPTDDHQAPHGLAAGAAQMAGAA